MMDWWGWIYGCRRAASTRLLDFLLLLTSAFINISICLLRGKKGKRAKPSSCLRDQLSKRSPCYMNTCFQVATVFSHQASTSQRSNGTNPPWIRQPTRHGTSMTVKGLKTSHMTSMTSIATTSQMKKTFSWPRPKLLQLQLVRRREGTKTGRYAQLSHLIS